MTPGIVAESDLAGNLKSEYVFFNGERVARRDYLSGSVAYYFSDHLKTAFVVTDTAGNIKTESDYYPWGGELQFVNNDSNHYKFTGKERDSESGLDYFGARYYSNALGRFISADWSSIPSPVPYAEFSDPQSLNQYSYVRNIPTVKVDADGHDSPIVEDDQAMKNFDESFGKTLQWIGKALQHPAVQAILSVAFFGAGEDGVADGVGEGTATHAGEGGAASGAAKGSTEGAATQGTKSGTEEGVGGSNQGSGLLAVHLAQNSQGPKAKKRRPQLRILQALQLTKQSLARLAARLHISFARIPTERRFMLSKRQGQTRVILGKLQTMSIITNQKTSRYVNCPSRT
jgi:RHS repeat-associated protein